MCIECNGTGTDSQNSDKCCDTCVGTGAVESIQDRYTSEPEAWKRRAEEEGAKLRNVEPVVPCQTVSELVAKLPMDAFLNQMPLAERIDYAEKLIQSAWDHWKKKEQSEPVKIESDTSAQGAEDYQSEKDATIAALRVELVASLRDRARMSIQLTDHIPVADQMAELRGQIHRLQKDKERLARCLEAIGADRPTAHTDEIWIQINTEIKAARQPE